jgi:hypothetical protein
MASINDIYTSKWLVAADLKRQPRTYTITRVSIGTVGQGAEAKTQLILNFEEIDKPLGLNVTNSRAIGNIYGEDYEEWTGEAVVLFPTKVDFNGQMKDAIRVDEAATREILQAKLREVRAAAKKPATPASPLKGKPMTQSEIDAEIGPDPSDDIPF